MGPDIARERPNLADRSRCGCVQRVAVDAAADCREGERPNAMLCRQPQRASIAARQELRLAVSAAAPYRTDCVNHVTRRQIEPRRDTAVPRRASHTWANFWNGATCLEQPRTRGPMNGAVHAPAAEHPLVGGVHDRVDHETRDVGVDDENRM